MPPRIFFVTGVVGAGKTSLIEPLRRRLGPDHDVHDFDERGVPDDVDLQWAAAERQHWLRVGAANLERGVSTVICGFVLPSDDDQRDGLEFILLDVDERALRERLTRRYSDPRNVEELWRMRGMSVEESVAENVRSIPWLRGLCSARGATIIDTSALTSAQTAEQVADWIRRSR